MDTEQEDQQRLSEFREKAKSASRAAELVDLIDRPLLTVAGWRVYADNRGFIGGIKVNDKGDEYEIRVGRLNRTIAGSLSPKRRPAKHTMLDSFKIAMGNAFQAQQMEVRKFIADDLPWQDIVKFI